MYVTSQCVNKKNSSKFHIPILIFSVILSNAFFRMSGDGGDISSI